MININTYDGPGMRVIESEGIMEPMYTESLNRFVALIYKVINHGDRPRSSTDGRVAAPVQISGKEGV